MIRLALLRNAFLYVNNREDAEDLVQNTFFAYFKNKDNFNHNSSLYTYLYAIMLNKIKKYYTKKKLLSLKVRELANIEINTDSEYEKFERKELISKIIVQMPFKYKTVLILRFFEELSYAEISEIIGWKLGTVKSRLFKAHNIMKKKLERYNA